MLAQHTRSALRVAVLATLPDTVAATHNRCTVHNERDMVKPSRLQRQRDRKRQLVEAAVRLRECLERLVAESHTAPLVPTLAGLMATEVAVATARRLGNRTDIPPKLRARLTALADESKEAVEVMRAARRLTADEREAGAMYAEIDGVRVPITNLKIEPASRALPVSDRVRAKQLERDRIRTLQRHPGVFVDTIDLGKFKIGST